MMIGVDMKNILEVKIVGAGVTFLLILGLFIPNCCCTSLSRDDPKPLATLEYEPKSHSFPNTLVSDETYNTIFSIWRGGGCCSIDYELSEQCTWVDVYPTSGSSNGEHDIITVTVRTAGLELGLHTCDIQITSNGGNGVFTVSVRIVENTPPELEYSPHSYDFGEVKVGETAKTIFNIFHEGYGDLSYQLTETFDWLTVSPTSGTTQGEFDPIEVSINTTDLTPGIFSGNIIITSDAGNGEFDLSFTVVIGPSFEVTITGGKGITVTIKNVGDAHATNISRAIFVSGGLLIKPRRLLDDIPVLAPGESTEVTMHVRGIGLGLFSQIPTITVILVFGDDQSMEESATARILFSHVWINESRTFSIIKNIRE